MFILYQVTNFLFFFQLTGCYSCTFKHNIVSFCSVDFGDFIFACPGSTKYRCIHHNSNWPEIHSQCTTNTSCYWSVRKKNSGEVVFKQGCSSESNPCVQTLRNREAIFCCNGSLCNDVESPIKSSNSTPICGNYSKPNVEPSVTGFTNITEEPGTGTNSRTQTEASITPSFTVEKISTNNEGSGNSLGKNEENLRSWLCSTSTLTSCSQHSQTLIVTITATITTTRTGQSTLLYITTLCPY